MLGPLHARTLRTFLLPRDKNNYRQQEAHRRATYADRRHGYTAYLPLPYMHGSADQARSSKAVKIKNLQDKVLPQLKQQLADTKGLFKGKERKALEVKIKETEAEIADRLDKIPDTLKEDGYPDVQVFMRTFREMESVVEQYNRDLAEWKYQVSRKPTATAKEQHRPPEKQSVLKHLREIQERNKQKPPQKQRKKSIDRDSR